MFAKRQVAFSFLVVLALVCSQAAACSPQAEGARQIIRNLLLRFPELQNEFGFRPNQGVLPGQQFVPGQQGFIPGQQGLIPGQQGLIPGQQGLIPGQQALIPGQQGIPGTVGRR